MNRPGCLILAFLSISFLSLFSNPESGGPAQDAPVVALRIDNRVILGLDRNFLTDPRVFNAEFYRKFNSRLHLANDADATRDWTTKGAKACRRDRFSLTRPIICNVTAILPQEIVSGQQIILSLPDLMKAESARSTVTGWSSTSTAMSIPRTIPI